MKVYSIGRERGCDIVISDPSDVISRRHAVLNVSPSGKMTIVDQSTNGTYVNGIRISSGVPFPVTRKDSISFAHVSRLNWDLIPSSNQNMKYATIAAIVIILLSGIGLGYRHYHNNPVSPEPENTVVNNKKEKSEEEIRKEIEDSLSRAKAKQDSLNKVKIQLDSIQKAKKDSITKAKIEQKKKKQQDKKTKPTKKQEEKKIIRLR